MADRFRLLGLCLLAIISSQVAAQRAHAGPPVLSRLFPAGGQRGTEVTVTCTGEFTWPVNVWAPGVNASCGPNAGQLQISIPADLSTDRVWIRLYNAEGVSAAMPLLIGSLPEVSEQEPNHALRAAQKVESTSVTVNGVLQESGDVDGFAIHVDAGQTLVASVDANGLLGSPMDAILQIASLDGYVLAENHDDVGLDPRIAFAPKQSGTYVVRIFAFPSNPDTTIAYRGGADYLYRLTLTTGPFISHAVPMTVAQQEPGTVEVFGWNIAQGTRIPVVPLSPSAMGEHTEFEMTGDGRNPLNSGIGFAFAKDMAGAARIRLAPHPVINELATHADGDPIRLTPSTSITGWIRGPKQTDVYRLPLKQNEPVIIAVESRSLNLPLHPTLNLVDASGTVLATAEPAEPQDAVITYRAPQDGDYFVRVGDRYQLGGQRCIYRLTVRKEESDFELLASADSVTVTSGQTAELAVNVQRRSGPEGSIGPITVTAIDLPEGVAAEPVVSNPGDATATTVTLKFTCNGPSFSGPIRIMGTCSEPKTLERFARTPPKFAVSFDTIWLTAVAAQ